VAPLIKNSGELLVKQIALEKTQSLSLEADRALGLMGRSIRMAGYRNAQSFSEGKILPQSESDFISIQKSNGYRGSDSLMVKHELSNGVDFDCIGNTLSKERTKNTFAHHGFLVDRQASAPKGMRVNGGSLICQSLDRQGRLQNTTLMNGVHLLAITELEGRPGRAFKIKLEMTDGALIHQEFERTFATRNLL
jgi:hypothetical protein